MSLVLQQPGSDTASARAACGGKFTNKELRKGREVLRRQWGRKEGHRELPALFKLCTPIRQMMSI